MAWILAHRWKDRIEVFDEVYLRDTHTEQSLDVLWGRYTKHKAGWQFYGDATARARKTAATTTDYLLILNDRRFAKAGRTVHYPKANPPISDRVAACNGLFRNADGDVRCMINAELCPRLVEDLETRTYKPGTKQPADEHPDQGHPTDALGYGIWRLFPLRLRSTGGTAKVGIYASN
jgi:hypothetical protein